VYFHDFLLFVIGLEIFPAGHFDDGEAGADAASACFYTCAIYHSAYSPETINSIRRHFPCVVGAVVNRGGSLSCL
jgi:hypothetical protein